MRRASTDRACLRYAARIRDHKYVGAASWLLAEAARDRGDAAGASRYLRDSLEAQMREIVRSGTPADNTAGLIGLEALRLADKGGDVVQAILIAESAKGISTAVSLMRSVPSQGAIPPDLKQLYERRESLRLRAIWEPGEAIDTELTAVANISQRSRDSIYRRLRGLAL